MASLALLTACGGSATESETSTDSTASTTPPASAQPPTSSAPVATESGSAPTAEQAQASSGEPAPELVEAAEALAQASKVAAETEEVKTTEELYVDIHEVYSSIEPYEALANANSSETKGPDSEESSEEASSDVQPREYVSADALAKLEEVATGVALEQYTATAVEYAVSGWHTEGKPKVVGEPRMVDGTYNGKPAKILEVCLDSSDVRLLDTQGNVVSTSQFPRSLNIFTLTEVGGAWKIASHDFPNNADC